ncbi:MAG: hypothetical protein R2836_09620 [Chitinophagales bacterium]
MKLMLTAPVGGDVENVVYGINHETVDIQMKKIFSGGFVYYQLLM